MAVLSELFFDYITSKAYMNSHESDGSVKAYRDCQIAVKEVPEQIQDDILTSVCEYGCEREEIGFVNGFKYAVQIMAECISKNQ